MQDCNIIKLWHTNRKEFINEFSMYQTIRNGNFKRTYFELKNNILTYVPNCQIIELRHTGLKDKNGKPIYEGDIIKHQMLKENFVVEYSDEHACFLEESKSFVGYFHELSHRALKDMEVIGNIYENKELLNEN